MENFRLVNLFLEQHKNCRVEKIFGELSITTRESKNDIVFVDKRGIFFVASNQHKHPSKKYYVYLHDCVEIASQLFLYKNLDEFRLSCLDLIDKHREQFLLAQDNPEKQAKLVKIFHKNLEVEFKKRNLQEFLPFKEKKFSFFRKLLGI